METGQPTLPEVIRWMEHHAAGATMPGTSRMLRTALGYLSMAEQGGAERHAYWYDVGAGGGYCSACRYKAKDRGRYCQHCGARMDAKKGE